MRIRNKGIAGALVAAVVGIGLAASPASAASGSCASYDACLYYNSNYGGAFFGDGSGDSSAADNYGSPNWYTFGGGGSGNGVYVKNNAASVFDFNANYSVTIYYNSNASGPSQYIQRNTGANLNSTLKNNNASQCFDVLNACP